MRASRAWCCIGPLPYVVRLFCCTSGSFAAALRGSSSVSVKSGFALCRGYCPGGVKQLLYDLAQVVAVSPAVMPDVSIWWYCEVSMLYTPWWYCEDTMAYTACWYGSVCAACVPVYKQPQSLADSGCISSGCAHTISLRLSFNWHACPLLACRVYIPCNACLCLQEVLFDMLSSLIGCGFICPAVSACGWG